MYWTAVLVLATCLKLLPKVGLRRLLILNLSFVGCEISLATLFCNYNPLTPEIQC